MRCGIRVTGQKFVVPREERLGISDFAEVALDEADTFGIKLAFASYRRD